MSKWDDEKTKVKDIFDSIRNFGLSGLVFFVGIQSLVKQDANGFMYYVSGFTGIGMIALSVYLFYINAASFNRTVQKEYKGGKISSLFFLVIPTLILILGVNVFTQTAFSIQTENSKKVGNFTLLETFPFLQKEITNEH